MAWLGTEKPEGAGAACLAAEHGDVGCSGRAHHGLGGPFCHNCHAAAREAGPQKPADSLRGEMLRDFLWLQL